MQVLPVPGQYSADLKSLINRLLSKQPAQRPTLAEVGAFWFEEPFAPARKARQRNGNSIPVWDA